MAAVVIMQGDSYPVLIDIEQDGVALTPDMIDDVEVCVGTELRKTYSAGEVGYDIDSGRWFIRPTQQETLNLDEDAYQVIVRVKYKNQPWPDVVGALAGRIMIRGSNSKEVL
jgi:hypothetical protein